MKEGWFDNVYLVLFDDAEIARATDGYRASEFLKGYKIIGLIGWDDFILQDSEGKLVQCPSVPMDPRHMSPLTPEWEGVALEADERFHGKVKWYAKPLVFGGDPVAEYNLV